MAKWAASHVPTGNALEAAVEAIDNTVTLHIIPDKEGGYILIQST
jgi:hypothetical protein